MINVAILASYNASTLDTLQVACANKQLDININLLISNNTNAVALSKADKYNIDNFLVNAKQFPNPDEKIYELLKKYNCEYVVLAGYMKKISTLITQNFKVINSHPSLLPNYGGAGMYGRLVHEAVVANVEPISGVTVHEVNEKYDEGKIILQKQLSLVDEETPESLETKVKALEKIAIVEALVKYLK